MAIGILQPHRGRIVQRKRCHSIRLAASKLRGRKRQEKKNE
ncbi:MAG: hypothetical protein QF473_24755 [Planctomycetota bacterium]|nr:hypothetical protein [Planctomycetota bacterium]